jgi:hypothetical protein
VHWLSFTWLIAQVTPRDYSVAVLAAAAKAKAIKVTFVKPNGERVVVDAPIGDSMLEVAHANKIEIEGPHSASTQSATAETSGDGVRRFTRDICGASNETGCRRLRRGDSVLHVPHYLSRGRVQKAS